MLEALPAGTTKVSTVVLHNDPQSLSGARHWGFAVEGHSIRSEYPHPGAQHRLHHGQASPWRTAPDLKFPDRDAVEATITASNTSPEGAAGKWIDLEMLAVSVDANSTPAGVFVRVHGVPAGQRLDLLVHHDQLGQLLGSEPAASLAGQVRGPHRGQDRSRASTRHPAVRKPK